MPSSTKPDAKQVAAQVRAYLAALPPETRKRMKQMQTVIKAAAPGATQAWSYSIPAMGLNNRILIWFAGWKEHTSAYPLTGDTRRALGSALKGYKTSKGTIQFPLDVPLPVGLLKRIVKSRVAELRAKESDRG